jgi:hypothetical protein
VAVPPAGAATYDKPAAVISTVSVELAVPPWPVVSV